MGAVGLIWRPFRVTGSILAVGRLLFTPGLLAILTKLAHRLVALAQGVLVLRLERRLRFQDFDDVPGRAQLAG
ncbi:MAG: hypothetical protein ACK56F_13425, partial [bacterium]